MVKYTLNHLEKGLIEYIDHKRYLWLMAIMLPVIPLGAIALYFQTHQAWLLAMPLLVFYGVIPIVDLIVGEDENNPPEAIVPQLECDNYYRWLAIATVPLHFLVLIAIAWVVGTETLSPIIVFALALTAGAYSGIGISTAHELGHKNTPLEKWMAKILLAVPAYGHFGIEHNRGHHIWVATPEDPASARMGESIYAFACREIPGAFMRGFNLEKQRLANKGQSFWSVENDLLQSYALSVLLQGCLIYAFGWIMLPFLIIHNVWAWFILTSANYIEHYGLLRGRLPNGRYEKCQPHHSWNANFIISNVQFFNIQRHSDHHANPTRRYQSLRNFDQIPQMPIGYHGMYMLAYCPPLWFRVMDKKLLSLPHINGDLSKVNQQAS